MTNSINKLIALAKPKLKNSYYLFRFDFTNIVDACCGMKSLELSGSTENLGTSSIIPNQLKYDFLGKDLLRFVKLRGALFCFSFLHHECRIKIR